MPRGVSSGHHERDSGVRRKLLRSSAFVRAARRAVRRQVSATKDIQAALNQLEEDAFHPRLRTHKLKGKLVGSWACAAGYDLGTVFKFVEHEGAEALPPVGDGRHP